MRKGNILPIAIMAFAIVAFLFVISYSINGGKLPWSTNSSSKSTTTSQATNDATVLPADGNYNRSIPVGGHANTNDVVYNVNQYSYTANANVVNLTNVSGQADWKTYTNTKYGYTIKYPKTWGFQEVSSTSLDGRPLIFTEFYENTADTTNPDGTLVIAYKNSPALFQDGKWNTAPGAITSVGGKVTTSTIYTPDASISGAAIKEKVDFTTEPSGWLNRGTAKDVNGNSYNWGNGDIQLLAGTSGKFDVLNSILSTFTFTK